LLNRSAEGAKNPEAYFALVGFPLFGFALMKFGWWLGRNEIVEITKFIERCCSGKSE